MLELFHAIADKGSAKVRRYVSDHELLSHVRFRNVVYDEVKADFTAHGGTDTPAIWDGEKLFTGAEACIMRLQRLSDVGR